jgi:DNA (cytosine-5)-methyltransferase 1
MGYHMAGFDVVGWDIVDQPNYPFEFHQGNALEVDVAGFDLVHVSPPCQGYSRLQHRTGRVYPLLIKPFRDKLVKAGVPFVIENVEDAIPEMINPTVLCGSSFGLRVRRHRAFEVSWGSLAEAPPCDHEWQDAHKPYKIYVGKSRTNGLGYRESGIQPVHGGNHNVGGNSLFYKSVAMGIDWMTEPEINESIPPAFTRFVGQQFLRST